MSLKNYILMLLVIFLFYILSCKPKNAVSSNIVFNPILEKYSTNDTSLIYKLDTILNFKWDRMIILTPYFNRKLIETCINDKIPKSKLEDTESSNEYLFIRNNEIEKYVLPSNNEQEKIILTYYDIKATQQNEFSCGIKNSPNLYIKLIPNQNLEWSGKTFLVFTR